MVATPSTVDCVMPQEFHGISTDVTDTLSSIVRLRRRGSNPNRPAFTIDTTEAAVLKGTAASALCMVFDFIPV